jgi:hypothetical protein
MFVHTNTWRASEPIPIFVGIYSGVWDFCHRYEDKRTMTEKYEYVYAGGIIHTVTNALPASPPPTTKIINKDVQFFQYLEDNFYQISLFEGAKDRDNGNLKHLFYVHESTGMDQEDARETALSVNGTFKIPATGNLEFLRLGHPGVYDRVQKGEIGLTLIFPHDYDEFLAGCGLHRDNRDIVRKIT